RRVSGDEDGEARAAVGGAQDGSERGGGACAAGRRGVDCIVPGADCCYPSGMTQLLASEQEMTLTQWADRDEDAPGELVDGCLVEDEEVGALHEAVGAWLVWVLMGWLGPRGVVLLSDARLGVTPRRGRKPDVSVYFAGREPPA